MPEWNLGDMIDRLFTYGHQYLSGDRDLVGNWAVEAVDEILQESEWEFAFREQTVTVPAALGGVGTIEQVFCNGRALAPARRTDARDAFGLDPVEGEPVYYGFTHDDVLRVWPGKTVEVTVAYYTTYGWKDPEGELHYKPTGNGDTPIIPPRYLDLVMLLMRVAAKQEAQDFDQAANIRQRYETRLEEVRSSANNRQIDELRRVRITNTDWS